MNAKKVRSAFLRGAATIALPTMAVCTHMVARNVAIMPSNPFFRGGKHRFREKLPVVLDEMQLPVAMFFKTLECAGKDVSTRCI